MLLRLFSWKILSDNPNSFLFPSIVVDVRISEDNVGCSANNEDGDVVEVVRRLQKPTNAEPPLHDDDNDDIIIGACANFIFENVNGRNAAAVVQ